MQKIGFGWALVCTSAIFQPAHAEASALSGYEMLVTSASYGTGDHKNGVFRFDAVTGKYLGTFGSGAQITDPRGIRLTPQGDRVMVNNGDDRILMFNAKTGTFAGQLPLFKNLDPGGSKFGKDGRYYVGARKSKSIVAFDLVKMSSPETFEHETYVKYPRGLAVTSAGKVYLASGTDPATGQGQNTILRFWPNGRLDETFKVDDPGLSPTDTEVGPNGDLFSGSERPFNDPSANTTVREYDERTGALKQVFDAGYDVDGHRVTERPRGITFGPDGDLYSAGRNNIVRYRLSTGKFDKVVVSSPGINAQSIIFIPKMPSARQP